MDGGNYSPVDYLRKYLLKNLREIIEDQESEDDIKVVIEKDRKRRGKMRRLAWYWLARARFYSFSPIFRDKDRERRKRDSGWGFIGSFTEDYLEYLEWLEWKKVKTFNEELVKTGMNWSG